MGAVDLTAYWWEFYHTYAHLPVNGKVVVDIGADYGNSPWFFLSRGAVKVIAYEKDDYLYSELVKHLGNDPRIEIHKEWKGEIVEADVLKIDCEGCEVLLTEEHFKKYPIWAIALHPYWIPRPEYRRLKELVDKYGGRLIYLSPQTITDPLGAEEMYIRV